MRFMFLTSRVVRCAFAFVIVLSFGPFARLRADTQAAGAGAKPKESALREPVAFRVYQRDRDGRADIPVTVDPGVKDASIVSAQLTGLPADATISFADGKFAGVPTGGPYRVKITLKVGDTEQTLSVE